MNGHREVGTDKSWEELRSEAEQCPSCLSRLLHQPALLGGGKSSLFSGSRPHRNSRDQLWLTDLPNYKATWSLHGERVGGGCGRAGMHHLQSLPLVASAAEAKEH